MAVEHRAGKPYVLRRSRPCATRRSRSGSLAGPAATVVKRLRDADRLLTSRKASFRARAERFRPPLRLTFEWSDDRVLLGAGVEGIPQALASTSDPRHAAHLSIFRSAVHAKMRERYGDRVPLDEPVISPATIFLAAADHGRRARAPAAPHLPPGQEDPQVPSGRRIARSPRARPGFLGTFDRGSGGDCRCFADDYLALPHRERLVDIHRVTGWSRLGTRFVGFLLSELLPTAMPRAERDSSVFRVAAAPS